jgi:hypothetical protein
MKYYLVNALILSVFLLNNNIISLFFILLMFAIVSVLYGEEKTSIPKLLVLFSISAAFILNIFNLDFKTNVRLFELIIGFTFFPIKFNSNHISIFILKIIVLYLFIFFIGNLLGIGFFQNFILKYYPAEGNSWEILYDGTASYTESITDILAQRLGSIYYNPNLLGQNLTLLIIIYLLVKTNLKFNNWDYLFLLLTLIMIIGSGSRTAFVVTIIILFFYFKNFISKKIFYYIIIPFFLLLLTIIAANTRLLEIFNQTDKATDSMGLKHDIVLDYLNAFNFKYILNYIFGFLSFDIQFDYDIGDILHNLGLFGLLTILYFMFYEFLKSNNKLKFYYSFLLISYGATLVINFKFFILTIILLSFIRAENKKQKLTTKSVLIKSELNSL